MGNETNAREADARARLCRELGLGDPAQAHQVVLEGARRGVEWLRQRQLNGQRLRQLGYTGEALKRFGYSDLVLMRLGMSGQPGGRAAGEPSATPAKASLTPERRAPGAGAGASPEAETMAQEVRRRIAQGQHAAELKHDGVTIHHCRRAGLSAAECVALGFQLSEMITAYSAAELRRADFRPGELRSFFSGDDLRRAGFSASDLRLAGFSVRDLLNLGYPENHVRTAGYSTAQLIKEGLSRTTRTEIT